MANHRPLAWMTPEERAAVSDKHLLDEHGNPITDRANRKYKAKGTRKKNLNDPIGSVNIRHSQLTRLHIIRDKMSKDGPRISIREALENVIIFWEKGNL